ADITAKSITIIADAKSKVYGEADPALTAATPAGVITGDMATGALTRAPGSSVGTYAISKGTYTYGANYTESFTGADLTITKKTIAVAAVAKTKVYGENDPTLTYTFSPALVSGDAFSGALTRASGNDVGTYAIQQGTLALSSNYTLNFTGANLTITKKTVTVTAEAKTKVYGTADPMLTYTYSPALVGNDSFSGALTRVAGEDVANSPYAIQQGTLALSSNYTLNYVGANLTITPQTANPLANTYYTGSTFFWTPSTTSSNAVLTLAATIKNSPNYGGDIRTAKVSFFIRNGQTVTPISGAQNLPVGLVNPNDLSVGSAATTVQYNLGSADYATLEIGISVSGNYTANPSQEFDKIITVAKPIPGGLIVGNAVLDDAGSSGYVSGSVTVGFGVQYNKSLKNPQGSVDMLVTSFRKSDGSPDITKHVYRIKSNAISVLSVGKPSSSDAQFTSKANISEVVNGVDQAIEGNCTMQFNMKQGPNDGPAGDEVAITIYRAKGGIWYSNNWNGTQTVLKQIETGNVSVSGGSAGTPRMGVEESSEPMMQLTVEASPNPTKGLLNVSVKGAGDQPSVKIRLYNLLQGVSGEWALDLQDGQGQKTIDIQSVNEGMYFLSVEGTNGRAVQRVLKGN
ncbi:MBG domain-containing protein, partial [Fibrivirga algicola]